MAIMWIDAIIATKCEMMMDKEFRIKKKCIYLFRFCPIMLNYLIVITGAVLNHCLRLSVSRGWHRLMRHPVLCPQCSLLHEFRKKSALWADKREKVSPSHHEGPCKNQKRHLLLQATALHCLENRE